MVAEKVQVSLITITRAEGLSKLCGKPKVYRSWDAARQGMMMDNSTYPGPDSGYDKHDFEVIFADRYVYTGRLDVKQVCCSNNDQDVRQHIRETMRFYAGIYRPAWMKEKDYEQSLLGVNRQEYVDFLDKYDV